MKIDVDQLDAINQMQKAHGTAAKNHPAQTSFDDIFARQFKNESKETVLTAPSLNPSLPLLIQNSEDKDIALLDATISSTASLLDNLDSYAKNLINSQTTSKNIWNNLLGLDEQISSLRQNMQKLGSRGSGLEGIVNELEVLASAEKVKFNRGDYL